MVAFSPCKINLGLHILAQRPDGYRDIETGFYPVPWYDVLEIVPAKKHILSCTGISFPSPPETNLCMRAYRLLREEFDLPPVGIYLHKTIPVGSGLGGGSSNAVHTLKLLNKIFDLRLSYGDFHTYASQLGSDCPFFLHQCAMLGRGTGNELTPLSLSLRGKYVALVFPSISITSAEAYNNTLPHPYDRSLQEILAGDRAQWKTVLVNEFENTIFQKYPVLSTIKAKLYDIGALYAGLSGSGSTLYGIFDKPVDIYRFFPTMLCRSLQV